MEVTRRLTVGCEFIHHSEIAVPAVFQVEPLSDQKVDVIDEHWSLEPEGSNPSLHRPVRESLSTFDGPGWTLLDQLSGDRDRS